MWRQHQEQKKAHPWSTWWEKDTQKANNTKTNTTPPPLLPPATTDRRDGMGIKFGGTGDPMDLDKAQAERRCFTHVSIRSISHDTAHTRDKWQSDRQL